MMINRFYWGGLSLYTCLFLLAVMLVFIQPIYSDGLIFAENFIQYQQNGYFLDYLWHPHNGHHLVWMRLLVALDIMLFGGKSYIISAFACLSMIVASVLFFNNLKQYFQTEPSRKILLFAVVIPFFSAFVALDVGVPVNTVYCFSFPFIFMMFSILCRENINFDTVAILILLALFAGFGNNVALAILPVWLLTAFVRFYNHNKNHHFLLFLTEILAIATIFILFFYNQIQAYIAELSINDTSFSGFKVILYIAWYFIKFCGLPWAASSPHFAYLGWIEIASTLVGLLVGITFFALAVLFFVKYWAAIIYQHDNVAQRKLVILIGNMILFSVSSGLLATIGRVSHSTHVPIRYTILLLPLHAGLLSWAVWNMGKYELRNRWGQLVLGLSLLIVIIQQGAYTIILQRYSYNIVDAVQRFKQGDDSDHIVNLVAYGMGIERARIIYSELDRRDLYKH